MTFMLELFDFFSSLITYLKYLRLLEWLSFGCCKSQAYATFIYIKYIFPWCLLPLRSYFCSALLLSNLGVCSGYVPYCFGYLGWRIYHQEYLSSDIAAVFVEHNSNSSSCQLTFRGFLRCLALLSADMCLQIFMLVLIHVQFNPHIELISLHFFFSIFVNGHVSDILPSRCVALPSYIFFVICR